MFVCVCFFSHNKNCRWLIFCLIIQDIHEAKFSGDDDYFNSGHFYPFLPIIRFIPQYQKDKNSKSRSACNKFIRTNGKGTPGLFMTFCLEHGKLIGFHAMKYAESARTVHNLLFSRFPQAPEVVCYDNACNFHLFVMFREPDFYRDMVPTLDRLHESCHNKCSPVYAPDLYLQLRGRNTQIAEQKNSTYVQKRASLFAMGHFMFLFHLRFYTWRRGTHSITLSHRHQAARERRKTKRTLAGRVAALHNKRQKRQ